MRRKTRLERLDDLVRWTGIPALSEQPPRRRPLRWPATLALTLALVGYATMAAVEFAGRTSAIGNAALMVGFATGVFMKIFGPLKPYGTVIERVDEWDRAARARSYLFTFVAFAVTTLVGLMLILATLALTQSIEATGQAIMALFFLLMTIISAMPTAHASWKWQWHD